MSAKYTAERAKFVFAQDMKPCPKCGSFHIMPQTPIKMEAVTVSDSAKQLLGKWARATLAGAMMEGPMFIICLECGHNGPSVDCTGMTRDEAGRDRARYTEVKRLWNEQPPSP